MDFKGDGVGGNGDDHEVDGEEGGEDSEGDDGDEKGVVAGPAHLVGPLGLHVFGNAGIQPEAVVVVVANAHFTHSAVLAPLLSLHRLHLTR
jgi:hypothetical protein